MTKQPRTISPFSRTFRTLLCCIPVLLCMGAIAVPVCADDPPVAAFTSNIQSGNSPLTVTFTDQSTNSPTSWLWDFGDGTTSTDKNPVHIFNLAGYYTVTLTATNGAGSDDEVKADYVTARCNLAIGGVANPQAGNVFAMEPNVLTVTLVKNTAGNSPATELQVSANDGWSGRVAIPAMNVTTGSTFIITDPTIRTTQGGTVTYTAKIDPDGLVPETSETDNTKTSTRSVKFNGYKGVQYWPGKESIVTYKTFDLRGNIVHSFGNSVYRSGSFGSGWTNLTWNWGYNATNPIYQDFAIPANGTVVAARLYIPYCWDYEDEVRYNTTTTFNGILITPEHWEEDTSNFGAYPDFRYGLLTYDVTGLYLKNQTNTVDFTRHDIMGKLSPAGFTLAVVYSDPSETRKQIFINEGWDLLGASTADYATSEEEATSYQEFSGMAIDMASALKANLTTFVPWGAPQNTGDPGEGNLFVNGVQIGSRVWNYGERTVGESDSPQVAVDVRDVMSYLNAGGTGNVIGIQSTTGGSPCMVAERAFLVVEYPDPVPVAAFSANPLSGSAPLTVLFTDESTNNPTSRIWDFGDGNSTWSSTVPTVAHTYTATGTFDVKLTAANAAGSDDELKTGYISVTSGSTPIPLPGVANPPTDPDGDGKYQDLNGNHGKDMGDVVLLFKHLSWIETNEPVTSFDFNGNGWMDMGDVVLLFKMPS